MHTDFIYFIPGGSTLSFPKSSFTPEDFVFVVTEGIPRFPLIPTFELTHYLSTLIKLAPGEAISPYNPVYRRPKPVSYPVLEIGRNIIGLV